MARAATMKAAILHRPGECRIERVPKPVPKPGEVLIRVKAVGMCGSDVHYYAHGRIGSFVVRKPIILGHECAGEIVQIGRGVKGWKSGDRVAVEPGATCMQCEHCKSGRYNLCTDVVFMATPPVNGAFCEYVTSPAHMVFSLPNRMRFEEGAMMEPLAVGVHACNRGEVAPGNTVAVLGAGPIGLVTLQVARARGAYPLIAVDVDSYRLRMAKRLGATYAVNAKRVDTIKRIMEITNGRGVDVVFETAGTTTTTQDTVAVARRGGILVWVGMGPDDVFPIPVMEAICKELDIRGLFRYANCYPPSIRLVESKRVNVKSMITHRFTLEEVPEALEFNATPGTNRIKSMIVV